jgi:hypothetical protein
MMRAAQRHDRDDGHGTPRHRQLRRPGQMSGYIAPLNWNLASLNFMLVPLGIELDLLPKLIFHNESWEWLRLPLPLPLPSSFQSTALAVTVPQ